MSSTERAPEPTMEEILASIRRIITDDEAGQAKAPDATSQAKAEDESLEGEADNQIIDDIARVLSGDAAETPEAQEEDILDLTAELGGLEIVEDDGDAVFEVEEVAEVLELEEVVVAEAPAEPQAEQLDVEVSVPAPAAQDAAPEPAFAAPPPQEAVTPPPMAPPLEPAQSAGEEAASALERAIAALRAGQPPSSTPPSSSTPPAQPFQFQTAPQPGSIAAAEAAAEVSSEPEPIPMAVPMSSPEVEAETHPELEAGFEPLGDADFESQPDVAPIAPMLDEMAEEPAEDLVLTEETEVTVIEEAEMEPEAETPFWSAPAATEEPEAEAEFSPQPVFASQSEPEPAPVAAQVNGAGAHHDVAGKTMEDSIKDMLRPMLRQWLDENMPRLIQEGFDPETLRREQD